MNEFKKLKKLTLDDLGLKYYQFLFYLIISPFVVFYLELKYIFISILYYFKDKFYK